VEDAAGNLYGTTWSGGNTGWGVIYQLQKIEGAWKYNVIHSFCPDPIADCEDGGRPTGNLIIDKAGNLYGTATLGGAYGEGSVYKMELDAGTWTLTVVYSFTGGTDGIHPGGLAYVGSTRGAIYDGVSPLYGATAYGGSQDHGVVYQLTPGNPWTQQSLYSFCSQSDCSDGAGPYPTLVAVSNSKLFGATGTGGNSSVGACSYGCGVVYELRKANGQWTEAALHAFCANGECSDGQFPGPMSLGLRGHLAGTALYGGAHGQGVAFTLSANMLDPKFKVIHDFCALGNCADGGQPSSQLSTTASGPFLGTTVQGGRGFGTIYLFSRSVDVLYDFCASGPPCLDGQGGGDVMQDGSGNIFGVSSEGGAHAAGTLYELLP
jgi:uncharacterized repeat protein (TIGR03803 family)